MELRNVMESLVASTLDEVLSRSPEICSCDRCRLDMLAFALNNLPPRYIVEDPEGIHAHLEAITAPFRGDVHYNVGRAVQMVSTRPHHAQAGSARHRLKD